MGQRIIVSALCAILAVFMITPAMAQDAYPPDESPEVIERGDEEEVEAEADAEVRGVALEQEESTLPLTGATIGVLAAAGLGVLVVGGVLLKTSRRRVDTK
jgi:LPXTG-motif cell wall-anchored protein